MTRRERLERKVEKREEWAQKRNKSAESHFTRADENAKCFENGQPILVGHHSEKMMRAAQERIFNNMDAAFQDQNMAKHHRSKAAGLQDQLDHSIYSDDPDAEEAISAKIEELENHQSIMVAVNKICRSRKISEADKPAEIRKLLPKFDDKAINNMLHPEYSFQSPGLESWMLSNNSANIRRYKQRLATIQARKTRLQRAADSETGITIDKYCQGKYCRITFAEKPEREILNDLRNAGFHWCGSYWDGEAEKIPESVAEMAK